MLSRLSRADGTALATNKITLLNEYLKIYEILIILDTNIKIKSKQTYFNL